MTRVVNIAQSGGNNVTMRNRIINGNMMIDQRNAGASKTINTDPVYTLDRWAAGVGSNVNNFTIQQSTTVPNSGYANSLLVTMGTGVTVSSSGYAYLYQAIEGYNIADLNLGSASASQFTVSFWVRSSVTGTFGVSLRNGASTATYCATYTISSANTWEQKSVTIPAITSGTWYTDNRAGIGLFFDLGVGSGYSGTANQLNTGANYFGVTGTTKLAATTGATFYITGVQLEAGTTATPFEQRLYGTELALCQRYCNVFTNSDSTNQRHSTFAMASSTTQVDSAFSFKTSMRTAPSVSVDTIANIKVSDGATAFTASAYSIMGAVNGSQQALVAFTSSGLTAFRPYFVEANGTLNSAKITFSSEL